MEVYKKIKKKLGILALFALMFQLIMPIYETYVYAEDNQSETEQVVEELDNENLEETKKENKEEDKNEPEDESDIEDQIIEKEESEENPEKEKEKDLVEEQEESEEEVDTKEEKTNENKATEDKKQFEDNIEAAVVPLREAEEITENIIDDMKLMYKDGTKFEDGDLIDVEEDLRFELDWSLSNDKDYVAGDYIEFNLPKQITVYNPLNGPLGDYGTYTVDTNGNVKFTFNEKVEEESDIKGTFWFDTELKESEVTSTEETIELVVNGKIVETVIVNVKPTAGQAIAKNGHPVDGNFNTEEVDWTVVVNTTRESLKNAIIDDSIQAGQELILDSLKLKEVEVNLAGEVTKELGIVTGFTNNSTQGNLNIKLGDTNKAYKLTFKTKLLEKDFKEGTTNYKNDAFLKSDGKEDAKAGGSVSVSRPKSMEKTSSAFDKENRSIEWTVNANYTEQSLKKDDVITDEFTFTVDGKELDDVFEINKGNISIEQVDTFDDKGKPTETSDAKDLFDITIEGNKVTYKLKEDSNKAFVLKYKTELKDGAYINKDGKITNKIDLNGKTSSSSQGVYQQVGKKTNAGINYEDKTIDWTITVNADKQDLRNFILTDDFSGSGQKLVKDSIEINPVVDSNKVEVNSDNESFKINFGDIKKTYTIKYQTEFTYDFENGKTPDFKNGVKISYETSDGSDYDLEFGNTVPPNATTKSNGAKNGIVDQKTKEITWKIDLNYNELALEDAKVRDAIPDNQSLIDGSVKVYETSIGKKGGVTKGNDVTDQFTLDASENQVNVDFGKINKSYRIEFKTKDKEGIYNSDEKYINTAEFIPRDGEKHNLTANVTLPNQGEFLGKSGTHNKDDWTIDWKIDVNKSLSTTSDFTITDDLGDTDAQILLEDTIKVTKAGSTDELEEGKDYELTVSGNGFKIYIPGKITEAYEVTYSSYIVAEETVDVTNDAEIQSNDVIKGTTDKTESVEIRISTGGGTGEGTTGGLILEKFEADSERALKDVAFSLIKTIGNKEIVVREGTTNAEGKLEWKGLKYGKYTLKEVIPEGYLGETEREVELSSKDPKGVKTLPIENKRETGTARIIKLDSSTEELLVGAEFTIKNQTTEQEYTFTTDDEGVILEDIPFGEYTIKEITAPTGYRITKDIPNITVEIGKIATIEVEDVAFVDVEGQKTWVVDEGKELPEDITVELLADGKTVVEQKVTKDNNWKYHFEDLDKYNRADREIKYEIKELDVDGYITEQEGYDLTNIQTTNISGTKVWKDDNNPARPSSITVQLLADGEKLKDRTAEVTASSDWKYSFDDLPKYTSDGDPIVYTIDELEVEGYDAVIDGFDITNTRANKISVTGEKTWKDEDPTDRPAEITVNLKREVDGEEDKDFNESKTVKPNFQGNWIYEFEELDEFDKDGVEYTYIIEEDNIPDNYESTVDGSNITNIRVGKTEVSGTKRWKDDKVTDRPESIKVNLLRNNVVVETIEEVTADDDWKYSFTGLDKYDENGQYYEYKISEEQVPGYAPKVNDYDITNTRSEKTNIEIIKGWLDDNSEDRSESIIVYVYQNNNYFDTVELAASEKWTYKMTDLEAYDEDGHPYTYEIKEKPLTEEDSKDQYETTINGFNITNLRVGKTEVIGEKNWDEVDKQYRPDSVTVNLLANGEPKDSVNISEGENWKYAFEDLDKYDDEGKEIEYRVEEDEVPPGYESSVNNSIITNKQITTEVAGEKIWLDDLDEHPEITINLLANGEKTDKSLKVSAATNWEYRFTEIPKYDKAGDEIEYTVEEETVDGYATTIEDFMVTNLRVGETEVTGEKKWKDAGPEDRPESIEVFLTRNVKGELDTDFEKQMTVTPDSEGDWNYTFKDLPKFNDKGIAYTYTVKEETEATGYESSVDGYDITNLRVGTVDISGTKTWNDDNIDGRPESITVNLLQNNSVIDTKVVKPSDLVDEWAYTFTDLDEFDEEGIAYDYRVSEEDVLGYTAEFDGMNITNTRSDKKDIEITKGWLDDNSENRPKSIKVDLYQNDELFKTAEVKASNDWVYEFKDLEAYDEEGQAYTYSIQEQEVEEYETQVDGFNLTNTRVGILSVEGEKIWKDDGSFDRPGSIEVTLTREQKGKMDEEFTMTETVTPDSSGKWTYAFEELPEFDEQGVAYDYLVEEDGVPEGYESSIDGYDITNLRVGTTEVNVFKNWANDSKDNRPMSIEIDLLQNGKVLKSVTLSEAAGWKYTFTDLPAFDKQGKSYKYTIQEKPVQGYETSIEETDAGFEITNTYVTPETPSESDKPKKTEDSDLPKTGEVDTSIFYLIGGLLVVIGLILGKRSTD